MMRVFAHSHSAVGKSVQAKTAGAGAGALAEARKRAKKRKRAAVALARKSTPFFIEYAIRNAQDDSRLRNAGFHEEWHRHLDAHRFAVLIASVEHAKALDLDTEVPTPDGWMRLGQLRVGDRVFARSGALAAVIGLSAVRFRPTWRVIFDDGAEIVADDDHQWVAWTQGDLDHGREPRTVTTRDIRQSVMRRGRYTWKVPVAGAAQYPERELPVHPYVLGAWLGDGDSQEPQFTCHRSDRAIVDRCVELEGGVCGIEHWRGDVLRMGVGVSIHTKRKASALSRRLKALGVVNNKHVPEIYMTASVEQRRQLLAGLLDTDGSVTRGKLGNSSRVTFGSSKERLATQALELVRSLGFKAKLIGKGPWRVTFTAREPVFWLQRKLDTQILDGDRRWTRHRTVKAVKPGPPRPVRCLSVDSPDETYLAGRSYTVTHNTQQISVGRLLHRLGQNPNRTIALISATATLAEKSLNQIRQLIDRSARVREIFPHLRRSSRRGDPWRKGEITVERATISKDPSIQARGVYGDIVGSRLSDIVLDDVLNFQNSRTEEQRKKLIEWFDTTVFTRLLPNGVIWAIGTPWHPDDFLHELEKRPDFFSARYPAVLNPDDPASRWIPRWPEQWDIGRLLERRRNMPEATFIRKYLCRVRLDSTSRFRQLWIDRMCMAGKGRTFLIGPPKTHIRGPALPCFTGVDLGVGDKDDNAQTVVFTIALLPDGRRLVVDIEAGRWQAPEIIDRIESAYLRFGAEVMVENNGAQQFLLDMCQGRVPVVAHRTGAQNKFHEQWGVESLAVEMRNGWWVMPSGTNGEHVPEEGQSFIRECLFYDPELHTGDRLMAAWIARECLRKFGTPTTKTLDSLAR